MKKVITVLLILSTIIFNGCNKEQANSKIEPEIISISEHIKVEVDPRIELLTTIQYLADQNLLTDLDLDYKKDIDEYFKDYKEHKAVTQYKELAKKGFIISQPIVYILNCNTLPDLEVSENINYSQDLLIIGVKDINEFRESMKEFYKETNFKKFYNSHKDLYGKILSSYTKDTNGLKNYINKLEEYTDKKQKSYNIILSPLIQGDFGISLNEENEKYDASVVVSARVPPEIYKKFDNDYEKAKEFSATSSAYKTGQPAIVHEFAHTHLRSMEKEPFLSMIKDKFNQIDKSYMEYSIEFYNTWKSIVNEYFVRAISARILYLDDEIEDYEISIKQDKIIGFTHIEKLTEKLKEYENNRDKYKQIEEFYPELLDELANQYK